ncbi:MAG TPA: ankyrin repeat domain-containing protein, partial [Gemmataceae bacterium]
RELLAAGADPNARDADGQSALRLADRGAGEIKWALIEAGAEDPAVQVNLVQAVMSGQAEAVRALIERGADVNVPTLSGTPLYAAVCRWREDMVDMLLAAGADPDAGNSLGTPLIEALQQGRESIARKLLAAGANPNRTPEPLFGEQASPLAHAVVQGDPDMVRPLIRAGADVNAVVSVIKLNAARLKRQASAAAATLGEIMKAFSGETPDTSDLNFGPIEEPQVAFDSTPAVLAARCGTIEALAVLLEAGADPYRKDGEGLAAYDWATRNGSADVPDVLRRFGVEGPRATPEERLLRAAERGDVAEIIESAWYVADLDAPDQRHQTRGRTPLMLAAAGGHLEAVEALLQAGADPNRDDAGGKPDKSLRSLVYHAGWEEVALACCGTGRTALMVAAAAGHAEVVRALLAAGADPNHQDVIRCHPLFLACANGHLESARELVRAGAKIDAKGPEGKTPLLVANDTGNAELVEFLVESGADVGAVDEEGVTFLMKAAARCDLEQVRLALARGADVNARSREGYTALVQAAGANHYVTPSEDDEDDDDRFYTRVVEQTPEGTRELRPLPEEHVLAVVRVLLEAGADPNPADCWQTPLTAAISNDQLEVAKLLLESGARVEETHGHGQTAFEMAEALKNHEALKLLKQYAKVWPPPKRPEGDEDEDGGDRWGPELPRPDFSEAARRPEYRQAVADLAALCGSEAVASPYVEGWFNVHVHTSRRKDIDTEAVQREFLE